MLTRRKVRNSDRNERLCNQIGERDVQKLLLGPNHLIYMKQTWNLILYDIQPLED